MEINNGFYSVNPDKFLAEIEEEKKYLNSGDITTDEFDNDMFEIRDDFYAKCYEKAEDLGYIHRGYMANLFMPDFDKQAGIKKVVNAKGWERHFVLVG